MGRGFPAHFFEVKDSRFELHLGGAKAFGMRSGELNSPLRPEASFHLRIRDWRRGESERGKQKKKKECGVKAGRNN